MCAGEHEYKVMGLAPYGLGGRPVQEIYGELKKLLWVDANGQWHRSYKTEILPYLQRVFRYRRFDHIAAAVQQLTEDLIRDWVSAWIRKTGISDIALGGGVFMNVKANKLLAELPEVHSVAVVPSSGDESTAIGAAVYGHISHDPHIPLKPVGPLYLGRGIGDDEVEAFIVGNRLHETYEITRPDDINDRVADLLAADEVVARCSGRMEFGARALGNRSILARPDRRDVVTFINDAIKSRDFWMPFAPSVLDVAFNDYVGNPKGIVSPYMMMAFDTTPQGRRHLAGAVHPKDGTARAQFLRREHNPDYYDLIEKFSRKTGIRAVLNTSFNIHGEPVVCSVHDAVDTLSRCGLKYLALGSFLLRKPG